MSQMFMVKANLELASGGKEEKIGETDTVNRSHKSDGDSAPDLLYVVEVLHDLDQT